MCSYLNANYLQKYAFHMSKMFYILRKFYASRNSINVFTVMLGGWWNQLIWLLYGINWLLCITHHWECYNEKLYVVNILFISKEPNAKFHVEKRLKYTILLLCLKYSRAKYIISHLTDALQKPYANLFENVQREQDE